MSYTSMLSSKPGIGNEFRTNREGTKEVWSPALYKKRAVARLQSIVGLAGFSVTAACGSAPDPQASQKYVIGEFKGRMDNLSMEAPWYKSLDELFPQVQYKGPDSNSAAPISEAVVVGNIIEVSKGTGLAPDGTRRIDFDDSEAISRTVHLDVAVEQAWTRDGGEPKNIEVGYVMDGATDFEKTRTGLKELGRIVLFLYRGSPVFSYKPSLFGIHYHGGLIATISGEGSLQLSFLETTTAKTLLGGVETLDKLASHAEDPEREIRITRENGELRREA